MSENRESTSRTEQKLKAYYEANPRQEFLPSLKEELLTKANARILKKKKKPLLPALFQRPALAVGFFAILILALGLMTPAGKGLAQQIVRFFIPATSDTLPVQSLLPTPNSGTTTLEPANILDAGLSVVEVETMAGFDVMEPNWLPKGLAFAGASYEPEYDSTRIFYRYVETNGLVIRQEPIQPAESCELCSIVGASAEIETVQLGDNFGEYVVGTWKFTDNGPYWDSDPFIKRLRWQSEGMAFELLYMGPPDSVTKQDLIKIANSLK